MRTKRLLLWALAGPLWLTPIIGADLQPIQPQHLSEHRLAAGPASAILPRGAILHAQFNGLLPVIEGLEGILKAAAPLQALPPDARNLLESPNPILLLAGLQTIGAPLDEAQIAQSFGLAARQPATVSLYLGDPRRMFIITLPVAQPDAFAGLLTGALKPREVERVELGQGAAVRIVPTAVPLPELYLACAQDRAYLCGDRALTLSLFALPPAERLEADGFLARALNEAAQQHVAVVCDPRMIKPVAVQLAQFQPLGMMLLQQKRKEFLADLPPAARQQLEQQFRAQFGVENLEQFADYLEAVVDVTSRQLLDYVTNQLLTFEGLCFTARLDARFPELGLRIYNQQYQPDTATRPIPRDELAEVLRWIGSDSPRLTVSGRQPPPAANPGVKNWVAAVREAFARKGLKSSWFDRFATLLEDTRALPTIESQVPWTLTLSAPVDPQPDLAQAESLLAYFKALRLPHLRAVKLVPDADPALLERCLREQADVRNRNREAAITFNRLTTQQEPWFDHDNRLLAESLDAGVRRLVTESTWRTHGGLFGYDQHELVNRRWFFARHVGPFLVFHQGGNNADWLAQLDASASRPLTPAVGKLLDRLPPDVNYVAIQRSLQQLPQFVDWLASLEDRVHADLAAYLVQARQKADGAETPDELKARLADLPMPELLYSLNRQPDTGELYVTLPGNLRFPRAKVLPLLQDVLAGYASTADEVGGSLVYTRVTPGLYQVGLLQSTEAFTRLVSTLGNAIAETYLASPAAHQKLRETLWSGEDGNPEAFDQILLANPRWHFLPRPQPKSPGRPRNSIPDRSPDTPDEAIDLSGYYNAALTDSWHAGGVPNNTLENLPQGLQPFGDVTFDVRGVIQLYGRLAAEQLSVSFPKAVENIAIHRTASRLHFLHACGWPAEPGTVIGLYIVHYADGQQREIPIRYGEDVLDWWTAAPDSGEATVAWSGPNLANPNGPPKSIYLTTWENPLPDVEITTMDYRSTGTDSAPFLIALTVE
ncbi:MAG: hypothetical protein HS113_16195 [Verrucomicrobiales bacterium]|nr:hypothetical protein [Verrucomicrobiales bacterium]